MRRRPWLPEVALALGLLSAPVSAAAPLSASLTCERRSEPGRVLCALRLTAAADHEIEWADALIVSAPSFAPPLRSRVAGRLAGRSATAEIPLALVATSSGDGTLRVRGRALVCGTGAARARCVPAESQAELSVIVGP